MKSIKIALSLCVLVFALLAVLTILGFLPGEQAVNWGGKAIGSIFVIGVALQVVGGILQGKSKPQNESDQGQGPRF